MTLFRRQGCPGGHLDDPATGGSQPHGADSQETEDSEGRER